MNSGAWVLLVSIIVSPQWTPVPQGAFLPQSIIHDVTCVLTSLELKSIEIHGGLHGRLVLKAPSCLAAAALQWMCGPPLLHSRKLNVSKRKSTSCDGCGGLTSADQPISCSPLFQFFFHFSRSANLLFWKAKKEGHSGALPFKQSLFAVLAIRFMVCQKSAMHEKPPPAPASSPLTVSFPQWAKLWYEPESCALPSRESCLMRLDKRLT